MDDKKLAAELEKLREEKVPAVFQDPTPSKTAAQFYTPQLAQRILELYSQGVSLSKICQQSEMPGYATLQKWVKAHPEFSRLFKAAREARALHFEDAAIQAAENADGKDRDRLLFEAYKWGAEVNDPLTYGKKVQATHSHEGKIVVQVVTGFGPPNKWQTPPKLNADGTINKDYVEPTEKEVIADVGHSKSNEKNAGGSENAGAENPRSSVESTGPKQHDRSSGSDMQDGAQPLESRKRHKASARSKKSAPVRRD